MIQNKGYSLYALFRKKVWGGEQSLYIPVCTFQGIYVEDVTLYTLNRPQEAHANDVRNGLYLE